MPIKIVPKNESYLEKRKRILKEQKRRKAAREAEKKQTIGPEKDIVRTRARKKSTSKLAALPISGKSKRMQKSKSRLNPSVDYSKTPKAPKGTIKKSSLGARNRPTGKAPTTKNITKSALGAKKPTEKFSSFGLYVLNQAEFENGVLLRLGSRFDSNKIALFSLNPT